MLTIHEMAQFSGPFKGMHSMLCMDGNLQQKRCCSAGRGDQPLEERQSFFVPEDIVAMMEKEVNNKRQARPHHPLEDDQDAVLPGLELQNHIFDGCTDRFKAAKGSYEKAESPIFSDTGLMSLTCRHDRVIFMVNLHDAGERQYNALALIQQLFLELPAIWNIGILYDIGCQLHRSMTKVSTFDAIVPFKKVVNIFLQYNLLPNYSHRITFGVSVFHAFGHEFSCQCIYHPQKRVGFGCTDGEGCERVWNQLLKEIPMLRVSGVRYILSLGAYHHIDITPIPQHYRRKFIINQKLAHMNEQNFVKLGAWWGQKMSRAYRKLNNAVDILDILDLGENYLRGQWHAQRDSVTTKTPGKGVKCCICEIFQ